MELDIRVLNPKVRPATVFKTFDALAVGESFDLLNDHDPQGVKGMLEVMRPGTYSWEKLESGPEVWRIRLSRTAPKGGNEPDASQISCGCNP
jgi:uncharacterized protein (DUF2249 family)